MSEVKKGIYRHYKGGEYEVLEEVKNSEDKSELIVYRDLKDKKKLWARPKKMFQEKVEIDGEKKDRFEFLREVEVDSFEQKYLRALADYQNLIRQSAKEKTEFIKFAIEDFLQELLPVYDHLKLSLKGLSEEEEKSPWAQGVRHVLNQFKNLLESRSVEEIKTEGEKFNHDEMEALDGEGEIVDKEVMPGYKLNGKVIRIAKVIVKK